MLINMIDNQVPSSVWTCIEPAVGITAACLSNMRPLFKVAHDKVWVGLASTITGRGSQHTNNDSHQSLHNKNSELTDNSNHSEKTNGSNDHTVSTEQEKQLGARPVSPRILA